MPIYEYKCGDCGKLFEEIVAMGSKKQFPCPVCKSMNTPKVLSVIGGIGKGSAETVSCGGGCPGAGQCGGGGACSQYS
jgi:putative FmdB family regulatory protein